MTPQSDTSFTAATADRRGFYSGINKTDERNPYKRYEHARCWDEGYARARAATKDDDTK